MVNLEDIIDGIAKKDREVVAENQSKMFEPRWLITSNDHQVHYIPPVTMSRRDWFAGMAMQGHLSRDRDGYCVAHEAVKQADALIKELDKK